MGRYYNNPTEGLSAQLRGIHPEIRWRVSDSGYIELAARQSGWLGVCKVEMLPTFTHFIMQNRVQTLFPELFVEKEEESMAYNTRDAEKKGLSFGVALKGVFQVRPDVSVGSAMSLGFDLADLFGMQGSDQIKAFVQGFVAGIDSTGQTAMTLLEQNIKED